MISILKYMYACDWPARGNGIRDGVQVADNIMHIKMVNAVNACQRMYYRILLVRVKLYFEQMSYTNINRNVPAEDTSIHIKLNVLILIIFE